MVEMHARAVARGCGAGGRVRATRVGRGVLCKLGAGAVGCSPAEGAAPQTQALGDFVNTSSYDSAGTEYTGACTHPSARLPLLSAPLPLPPAPGRGARDGRGMVRGGVTAGAVSGGAAGAAGRVSEGHRGGGLWGGGRVSVRIVGVAWTGVSRAGVG